MQSLWTSNVTVMRVTEEGFERTEVIPGNIIPEKLNDLKLTKLRENSNRWSRWKHCIE